MLLAKVQVHSSSGFLSFLHSELFSSVRCYRVGETPCLHVQQQRRVPSLSGGSATSGIECDPLSELFEHATIMHYWAGSAEASVIAG